MDFVFRFYLLFSIGWIARSALYREMHERIEKGGKKWETYSTDVCVFSLLYCELNLKIRSNRKLHTLADFQWHSVFCCCCCCCRCLSTRISFTFYESDFDCHISMSGDTLFSSTRIIAWRSLCPYFFLLLSFRWFFPCVDCRYTTHRSIHSWRKIYTSHRIDFIGTLFKTANAPISFLVFFCCCCCCSSGCFVCLFRKKLIIE